LAPGREYGLGQQFYLKEWIGVNRSGGVSTLSKECRVRKTMTTRKYVFSVGSSFWYDVQ